MAGGQENEQEGQGNSIVKATLHVEGLSDAHGNTRTADHGLAERGIGGCKNDSQQYGFPDTEGLKENDRNRCPSNNGEW